MGGHSALLFLSHFLEPACFYHKKGRYCKGIEKQTTTMANRITKQQLNKIFLKDLFDMAADCGIEVEWYGGGSWDFFKGGNHVASISKYKESDGYNYYHFEDHMASKARVRKNRFNYQDYLREIIFKYQARA